MLFLPSFQGSDPVNYVIFNYTNPFSDTSYI